MKKFFVLEGLDGSGKTTVLERLKKDFPNFVFTREPGGSDFGERVREVLLDSKSKDVPALPMLLGFMAARASNFQELVLPALKEEKVVVSDRFDASTYAFQIYARQSERLKKTFWFLRSEILWQEKGGTIYFPHYVYLRLEPKMASERRKIRQNAGNRGTHFDLQKEQFHQRVFDGYEAFFKEISGALFKASHLTVVDASLSEYEVYQKVKEIMSSV